MPIAVVDASVLLLALEPGGDAARAALVALAEERNLVAPALLPFELGHVIHRKHPLRYGATPEERDLAFEAALMAVDAVQMDAATLHVAARLVDEHRLSFYDAAYLALALRHEDALLVTEDDALRQVAARTLGAARALDATQAAKLAGE